MLKEMENILKAFPSFLSLVSESRNPFIEDKGKRKTLETATKAVWFLIPFHFFAFLGMVSVASNNTTILIFVGFASLLGLSWVGTIIGVVAAKLSGWGPVRRENCVATWVASLFITWFYCVAFISLFNFSSWALRLKFETWPNIFNEVQHYINRTIVDELSADVWVILGVPIIASIGMLISLPPNRRSTVPQWIILAVVCAGACAVFIYFCKDFQAPKIGGAASAQ
ncbi:hypothetical protein [Ruegeria arenilitoris]|uniref:hypothetical protein n=1 Tax=Ruegeria arenilitoris TaxID=1173585 RepID=UPI00147B2AE0|nr:hypothetical protein [Ruegeria arenilitoris]